MKKNVYECNKCGHEIKTANRDEGKAPFFIGCDQRGCPGMARSQGYLVDQGLTPDWIFIRPKDKQEWMAIEKELKKDVKIKNPKKKAIRIERIYNKAIRIIRFHINTGGLVQLPRNIIEELKNKPHGRFCNTK